MIAAAAVHASARGIAAEAAFERDRLDALVQFQRRIERRAGGAIGDEFDGLEQAATPDVADMPVIAETLGQPPFELTRRSSLTLSSNCSSSITRCTSSAAAQASGCAR